MLRKLSWRARLVGLVVLVLTLSFLFQVFYVIPHVRDEAIAAAKVYLEEIARNVAHGLQTDLSQTLGRLTELSMKLEFLNWDLEAIGATISTLAHGSYRFESLFLVDAEGWFVAGTTDDLSVYATKGYADQPWFSIPFVEGETYFAAPRFYPSAGLV